MREGNEIKVSLFLTTYNWTEALEACVKSIFNQEVLPNEIIIADDGSGDETRNLVNMLQQNSPVPIKHVWQKDNGFRINAIRNMAIKEANYPYIIQIDGDMILDKYFVMDHIDHAKIGRALFGKRIELDQETSQMICDNAGKNLVLTSYRSKVLGWLRHIFIYGSKSVKGVNGCNMSYWKSDAVKVNGYDEDMQSKGPNDKEFAMRLIHLGVKSYYIKFVGIGYHIKHGEEGRRLDYEFVKGVFEDTLQAKKIRCKNGIEKD